MTAYRFLEPVDVLFLRGNRLFGDPGSYGESLVPPWPSVAAGAIRSQMMVEAGIDFTAFRDGVASLPELGTLDVPGPFRVSGFWLARRAENGQVEILHPLPADRVASRDDDGKLVIDPLRPHRPAAGLDSSVLLPLLPVLQRDRQAKPVSGIWLTQRGWSRYLSGQELSAADLIEAGELWALDHRVGVGLNADQRRAEDGKLFSMQAVALREGCGFVAAIDGAEPPDDGLLRLGGDGRVAAVGEVELEPHGPDLAAIAEAGRCRLVLTTPGIFPDGWRLPGMAEDGYFELLGVRGRVVCAAVPRAEVISGWDLACWQPKPAQRAAPAGSVYWIEDLEAMPEQLGRLADHGLWPESDYDARRRAEGFNRFAFATY